MDISVSILECAKSLERKMSRGEPLDTTVHISTDLLERGKRMYHKATTEKKKRSVCVLLAVENQRLDEEYDLRRVKFLKNYFHKEQPSDD